MSRSRGQLSPFRILGEDWFIPKTTLAIGSPERADLVPLGLGLTVILPIFTIFTIESVTFILKGGCELFDPEWEG